MFRGSTKTKMFLWTIVLVALASVACLGAVVMGGSIYFAYLAFGGILFSVTYSQLGYFRDVTAEISEQGKLDASIHKHNKEKKAKFIETTDGNSTKKRAEQMEEFGEENGLQHYNEDEIKKVLVEYKAKKESFLVLIDSSEEYHIKNCPGYIWSDKKRVYFLLLEKKTRIIAIPRTETNVLRYEKGVIVRDIEEYKEVKDAFFLYSMYKDFFPEYYRTVTNGLSTFKKNLFIIGEDIRVTAKSVRGIMKATQCRLELDDQQFDKQRYGGYFEEAYKANLLFREEVYDQEEFKERIREILTGLAMHEEKAEVYQNTIFQLVQYRLISQEYAEFYLNHRNQLEQKKIKKKKKK